MLTGSAVTGGIKYNNQMMFTYPFIVDRSDSAMHSSQRGMTIKPTWLLCAPWIGSLDTSARVGFRGRNEREKRETS